MYLYVLYLLKLVIDYKAVVAKVGERATTNVFSEVMKALEIFGFNFLRNISSFPLQLLLRLLCEVSTPRNLPLYGNTIRCCYHTEARGNKDYLIPSIDSCCSRSHTTIIQRMTSVLTSFTVQRRYMIQYMTVTLHIGCCLQCICDLCD